MPRSHADVQQPLELEPQAAGHPTVAPAALGNGFSPAAVQALQRTAGNQAVQRMLVQGRTTAPAIQRFEAQHHEHAERAALAAPSPAGAPGFTDAEASAVYFGNWSRDLSQALLNHPVIRTLGQEAVFEILNLLAMQKFGRELNPHDFGVYSPREHIDNPAGQTTGDLSQPGTGGGRHELPQQEDLSSPQAIGELFTVNEAGLPAYLGRSIQYVEEEFSSAADLGRTTDGLMHMGNGLHTVEDLFAHSNFVEIAVGKLITSGRLSVSAELQTELAGRGENGPVETLAGRTEAGRPILTTGSYVASDTLVSISEALTAFLEEFDPFSPSNKERSQALMERILARYEGTGRAGQLVRGVMSSMATEIPGQLREWITAKIEPAEPNAGEEQSVLDQAIAGARHWAAGAVGTALDAVADLAGWDWLQDRFAQAADTYASLPLTDIYHFTTKARNSIDEWFKDVDARLMGVPFYPEFRAWVSQRLDGLRESLKEVIKTALKAAADLIKSAFGESVAEGSNIHAQIESAVQSQIKNAEARAEYEAASHEQKVAMLADPGWCSRARITRSDAEHLSAMIQTPEWAQEGPSHSQIAKDHADSPFFGTAAALAMHADTHLRDLLVAVWSAEGRNATDPALAASYEGEVDPKLLAAMDDPALSPYERRRARREAQEQAPHWHDMQRRREGEQLASEGAFAEAEEDHPGEDAYAAVIAGLGRLAETTERLPADLRALAARAEPAAPDGARELRDIASAIPSGLHDLAEEAEHAADAEAMRRVADRLRAMADATDGLVARAQSALRRIADRVEAADPAGDALAGDLRDFADRFEAVAPELAAGLRTAAAAMTEAARGQVITDEQLARTHAVRAPTGAWAPELAASHARGGTPERDALFAFVRELFGHPYDTTWWEGPLVAWAGIAGNQERLEHYIRVRNSGRTHHHH
jgi:hypothetical protein